MAAQRLWSADEAFTLVRRAYPYRDLSRDDFNGCLDYLSGRHGAKKGARPLESRVLSPYSHRESHAWLPARLRWDGDEFTICRTRFRFLHPKAGAEEASHDLLAKEATEVTQTMGQPAPPLRRFSR